MLKLKQGVDPGPKALELMWHVVADVYAHYGYDCVITSIYEGVHGSGSLHPLGRATDFRTFHVAAEQLPNLMQEIRNNLGHDYDVVIESDHLHVEFDPKNPNGSKKLVAVI